MDPIPHESVSSEYCYFEDKRRGNYVSFTTHDGANAYRITAPIPDEETCRAIHDGDKVVVDANDLVALRMAFAIIRNGGEYFVDDYEAILEKYN